MFPTKPVILMFLPLIQCVCVIFGRLCLILTDKNGALRPKCCLWLLFWTDCPVLIPGHNPANLPSQEINDRMWESERKITSWSALESGTEDLTRYPTVQANIQEKNIKKVKIKNLRHIPCGVIICSLGGAKLLIHCAS